MNLNPYNRTDYENKSNWTLGENKPKQTQFYLPPGEPALLALRLVRRSFSGDGSWFLSSLGEGGWRRMIAKNDSEGGSAAEGGLAMTFLGAFLQRVAARPEKTVGTMNLLAIKSYRIYLNSYLLLSKY